MLQAAIGTGQPFAQKARVLVVSCNGPKVLWAPVLVGARFFSADFEVVLHADFPKEESTAVKALQGHSWIFDGIIFFFLIAR